MCTRQNVEYTTLLLNKEHKDCTFVSEDSMLSLWYYFPRKGSYYVPELQTLRAFLCGTNLVDSVVRS